MSGFGAVVLYGFEPLTVQASITLCFEADERL